MADKPYCGFKNIPKGRKRGTMQECAKSGRLAYYGINKVDEKLLEKLLQARKGNKKGKTPAKMPVKEEDNTLDKQKATIEKYKKKLAERRKEIIDLKEDLKKKEQTRKDIDYEAQEQEKEKEQERKDIEYEKKEREKEKEREELYGEIEKPTKHELDGMRLYYVGEQTSDEEERGEIHIGLHGWITSLYDEQKYRKSGAGKYKCNNFLLSYDGPYEMKTTLSFTNNDVGMGKEIILLCRNEIKRLAGIIFEVVSVEKKKYSSVYINFVAKSNEAAREVGKNLIKYALQLSKRFANYPIKYVSLLVEHSDKKKSLVDYYEKIGFDSNRTIIQHTEEDEQYRIKLMRGDYNEILSKFVPPTSTIQQEMTHNLPKHQEYKEINKPKILEEKKQELSNLKNRIDSTLDEYNKILQQYKKIPSSKNDNDVPDIQELFEKLKNQPNYKTILLAYDNLKKEIGDQLPLITADSKNELFKLFTKWSKIKKTGTEKSRKYYHEFINMIHNIPFNIKVKGGNFLDNNIEGAGIPLSDAEKFVNKLPKYILPAGSVVYKKENLGDIDLITTKPIEETYEYFKKNYENIKEIECKTKKCFFKIHIDDKPVELNIWYATKEELPYMIFGRSYPTKFNIKVRSAVKRKGYTLSDYDLRDKSGKHVNMKTSKDFFKFFKKIGLNIPYRTPKEEYDKELKGGDFGVGISADGVPENIVQQGDSDDVKSKKNFAQMVNLTTGQRRIYNGYKTTRTKDVPWYLTPVQGVINAREAINSGDNPILNLASNIPIVGTIIKTVASKNPEELVTNVNKLGNEAIEGDKKYSDIKALKGNGIIEGDEKYINPRVFRGKGYNDIPTLHKLVQKDLPDLPQKEQEKIKKKLDSLESEYIKILDSTDKIVHKNEGSGLGTKAFQLASNAYRKLAFGSKARQLYEGELHPTIPNFAANFCGPGTKIDRSDVRNFPPYNQVDAVCKKHDIAYHDAAGKPNKSELIREADEEMLKELEKYKNITGYTLAKKAIQGKIHLEDVAGPLVKYVAPEHVGKKNLTK